MIKLRKGRKKEGKVRKKMEGNKEKGKDGQNKGE